MTISIITASYNYEKYIKDTILRKLLILKINME